MRTTAADSRMKFLLRLTLNVGTILCSRTVCFSNKGLYLRHLSSVIKIVVLLSAAVVRTGVNCARLFGMSTTFWLE
jgi:hypothetical protein